jgi:GNAT superfamily N-acetyltransferase
MSSSLEILPIDPFDGPAVDAWWDAYAAAELADRGTDAPLWSREESRSELQQQSHTVHRHAFLARVDGAVVGAGRLALPAKDNTHVAVVGAHVLPDHRRQGIGSQILAHLEDAARSAGRTVLQGSTSWPYASGPEGGGTPGIEFARTRGFTLALGDVQSRLALPVPESLLAELDAEVAGAAGGYTVHSWSGEVPEDFVFGFAILDAAVDTEAPTGELDVEPARPDVAGIRENEELLRRQNRTSFGSVAVTADGQVAAYTQLVVSGDDGNAYQWGTLVRREDRGHRLGMAVKLANLRTLQREVPQAPAIYTYNADANAQMLAINTRLGFTPSERLGELQKRLS